MPSPRAPSTSRTFSQVLEDLGAGDNPSLTLDEVVEAFGDRGIGALILVLALMALLPWPPGGKAVFAAPIILLALELAFQRNEVWLPRWLLKASVSRAAYIKLLTTPFAAPAWLRRWVLTREFRIGLGGTQARYHFARWVRRLVRRHPRGMTVIRALRSAENLTRPRLPLLNGPVAEVLMGSACVLLAMMMALPVPLGDALPGLAIVFFALGVMQKDGVAVLMGVAGTVLSAGYLFLVWATVSEIVHRLAGWAVGLFN